MSVYNDNGGLLVINSLNYTNVAFLSDTLVSKIKIHIN